MLRHERIQEPHSESRAPTPIGLGLWRAHCGAGNVKMRPWRLLDEPLQELRCANRAGLSSARILHIGKFRFQHLVVFGPERHPPNALPRLLSRLDETLR